MLAILEFLECFGGGGNTNEVPTFDLAKFCPKNSKKTKKFWRSLRHKILNQFTTTDRQTGLKTLPSRKIKAQVSVLFVVI